MRARGIITSRGRRSIQLFTIWTVMQLFRYGKSMKVSRINWIATCRSWDSNGRSREFYRRGLNFLRILETSIPPRQHSSFSSCFTSTFVSNQPIEIFSNFTTWKSRRAEQLIYKNRCSKRAMSVTQIQTPSLNCQLCMCIRIPGYVFRKIILAHNCHVCIMHLYINTVNKWFWFIGVVLFR